MRYLQRYRKNHARRANPWRRNPVGYRRNPWRKKQVLTREDLLAYGEQKLQEIARELHDGVIGRLQALYSNADFALVEMDAGNIPAARHHLDNMMVALDSSVTALRHIMRGVSPVSFGPHGLQEALKLLCNDIRKMFRIHCELRLDHFALSNNVAATHIYRIIQEAVSNAIRHGGADSLQISVSVEANKCLMVSIDDNGKGISNGKLAVGSSGFGTTTMAFRAAELGGTLAIASKRHDAGVMVLLYTGPVLD